MKRSKLAKLVLMGASPFILLGCDDTPPPPTSFKTLDECLQRTDIPDDACQTAYAQAKERLEKDAPRFQERASCESTFGYGNCEMVQRADGSSWFFPAMTGFMIANALNRDECNRNYDNCRSYGGGGYYGGRFYSAYPSYGRGTTYSSDTKYANQIFKAKAATTSRGGFGSISAARGSWGS